MSQKLILTIYEAFADQLSIAHKKPLVKEDLQGVIASLNLLDTKISELISTYESAIQSVSFFEKEKEMRIKFPDIWKMQLQQANDFQKAIKNKIIELGRKYSANIEQIFQYYENKKLSLDDFSQIN